MTYATLMVPLQLGRANAALLQVVGDLAERFHAGVIGVAACRPLQVVCRESPVPAVLFEEDRKLIDRELKAAEAEFRTVLQSRAGRLEWRPRVTVLPLSDYLAREARSADLVVMGVDRNVPLRCDAAGRSPGPRDAGGAADSRRPGRGSPEPLRARARRLEGNGRSAPRHRRRPAVPGPRRSRDRCRNRRRGGAGRSPHAPGRCRRLARASRDQGPVRGRSLPVEPMPRDWLPSPKNKRPIWSSRAPMATAGCANGSWAA